MFGYTIKTEKQYEREVIAKRSRRWLDDELILARARAINAHRRRARVHAGTHTRIPAGERGQY